MEALDIKQMLQAAKLLAEEKNLPEDVVLAVVEQAIAAAWRRDHGERDQNVRAELNVNTGEAEVFVSREVIEDGVAYNPTTEIPLAEAKKQKPDVEIGDTVEESHKVTEIGRIAAQVAKQVLVSQIREAEREVVLQMFEDKIGTVVNGTVSRVESRAVLVDLGKAVGVMPQTEQIPGEYYSVGNRLKVYIKGVDRGDRGAQLIVTRASEEFIEYLFRQEVPEIAAGSAEIKAIAREAGRRTKMAVASTLQGVDPVGTFVGSHGVRVQAVMNEIGNREKIDIVAWNEDPKIFIKDAISPAEIEKVEVTDEGRKRAKVLVSEDQQPIAIGRSGQNVRLASRLTGYELDIEVAKPKAPAKKVEKRTSKSVENSLFAAVKEAEKTD